MRLFTLVIALVVCFPLAVQAQFGITAVEGVVKGFDGNPLPNATLVFFDSGMGGKYLLKTDKNGSYFGGNIRTGNYTVTVISAEGEQLWRRHNIIVLLGARGSTAFLNKYDIDLAEAKRQMEKEGRALVDPAQFSSAHAVEQAASAASRLKDVHVTAKLNAAAIAEQNHDFAGAEKFIQDAIALRPDAGSLWARLALLRLRAGAAADEANALRWYQNSLEASDRALAIEPSTGAYLNNKAEALGRMRLFEDAIKSYSEAVATNDGDAALYRSNRGLTLTRASLQEQDTERRRALLEQANGDLDAAVKLDPTLTDALFQRAVNQLAFIDSRPDPKSTVAALRRYLELAPKGKHAQEARDLIAQLKK